MGAEPSLRRVGGELAPALHRCAAGLANGQRPQTGRTRITDRRGRSQVPEQHRGRASLMTILGRCRQSRSFPSPSAYFKVGVPYSTRNSKRKGQESTKRKSRFAMGRPVPAATHGRPMARNHAIFYPMALARQVPLPCHSVPILIVRSLPFSAIMVRVSV